MSGSTTNTFLILASDAKARGDRVARLARHALTQRDAHVEHAAARCGGTDAERLAHRAFERAPDHHFGAQRAELRRVGAGEIFAADGRGLEQCVLAARDGGEVEDGIALERTVVAEEFAVRPFRLDMAALVEIAFEDHLGVGRHHDVIGDAFDDRQRRIAQRCDKTEFVDRQPHRRRHIVDRMRADDKRHRQRLAGRGAGFIDRAQVARRDKIDAALLAATQHQPANADVGEAVARIDDIVDAGRNIRAAVDAMLKMNRQLGEIGVVAGEHDLLHRRDIARDFDRDRLLLQATLDFRQQLVGRDFECAREPRPAGEHVADQFLFLRPGGAEQRGLAVAVERCGDIGEIDRLIDDFDFVRAELVEETAQAETVQIEIGRLASRLGLCRSRSLRCLRYCFGLSSD